MKTERQRQRQRGSWEDTERQTQTEREREEALSWYFEDKSLPLVLQPKWGVTSSVHVVTRLSHVSLTCVGFSEAGKLT